MNSPVCRTCGGIVVHGNLYCSKTCGQQLKTVAAKLLDAGFERDAGTPNIFRKSGIAVTVEGAAHVGMDKTIAHHAHAAPIHGALEATE